jgi:hypothetical protein
MVGRGVVVLCSGRDVRSCLAAARHGIICSPTDQPASNDTTRNSATKVPLRTPPNHERTGSACHRTDIICIEN